MMQLSIATDIPCIGCGYNLRMQPVSGVCTECGLAVESSLNQTILRWGARRLRRIAWAVRVQALTAIVIPLILPMGIMLDEWVVTPISYKYSDYVGAATFATMSLLGILHVAAAWFATSAPHGEGHSISRWLCRLSSVTIPMALLVPCVIILMEHVNGDVGVYAGLVMPILLAGWIIYSERAAACWVDFHRRGGLSTRMGMGKWSLRGFALAMVLLTAIFGVIMTLEALSHWNVIDWDMRQRIEKFAEPLLVGAVVLAGLFILLIIIALFRCGNRAAELARLARAAEENSFTAPAPTPDAPAAA